MKPSNLSIALGETGGKRNSGVAMATPNGVELSGKWNYKLHRAPMEPQSLKAVDYGEVGLIGILIELKTINQMITEHKQEVADFIGSVFLKEMGELVDFEEAPYIKFLLLIQGIEFLGACQDNKPFEESGHSEKRFRKGMLLLGKKYENYLVKKDEIYFYRDFRCPMIHQFKHNQKKITLGTRHGVNHQDIHLTKNENGQLYIILEDFYDDIHDAAIDLIDMINAGKFTLNKLSEPYLIVHKIAELSRTTS